MSTPSVPVPPRPSTKAASRSDLASVGGKAAETKTSTGKATGRWTKEEHFRFLEALKLYGKEWKKVQQHVGSRSSTQARSHAQKFFVKLEKKGLTMEQFLEQIDMNNLKQSMMDADSDYGDESERGPTELASQASLSVGQPAHLALKSPRSKYRRQSLQVPQRPVELSVPVLPSEEGQVNWPIGGIQYAEGGTVLAENVV